MRVVASAPGKVILFGEHFVVKGARAIATAISLRVRVIVEPAEKDLVVIESKKLKAIWKARVSDLSFEDTEAKPFAALLRALRDRGYDIIPHRAIIDSEIPVGAGLGSSAASAVAYALAYSTLHGSPLNPRDLFDVTFESEKVAHGKPSGIDNTIAIWGGTIAYKRGFEPESVRVDKRGLGGYVFIVMDTGIKRSTRDVVEHALKIAEKNWSIIKLVYDAAEALVEEARKALDSGNAERLGELMNINHGLLVSIGVSNLELDYLVNKARLCGASGAKLTGAGWGGSAIALASITLADKVVECLSERASFISKIEIDSVGARVEES